MNLETKNLDTVKMNGALDFTKLLMAILVIGIHTEPFGFNYWLDKGFGIVTRLCVPFFFVTSAYLFWKKENSSKKFLLRILILFVVWSIIYLPFDIKKLSQMSAPALIRRVLLYGNEHALWYLWATIVGLIITLALLKFLKPKYVLIIAIVLLFIGTVKTTYSTAVYQIFGINLPNHLGIRNGLFYGFPYIALGMVIAKSEAKGIYRSKIPLFIGLFISVCLLAVESFLFVIRFKSDETILWLSVFPYTFFFFEIVLNTNIQLSKPLSVMFRRMSTIMYVSQYLFIPVLSVYTSYMTLFILTVFATGVLSLIIIKLSEVKQLGFLKYLY